jgi:hypothetical protein
MSAVVFTTVKLNFIRSFYRSLCYITTSFGHLSLYVPPALSETSDKSLRIKLISSVVLEGLDGRKSKKVGKGKQGAQRMLR